MVIIVFMFSFNAHTQREVVVLCYVALWQVPVFLFQLNELIWKLQYLRTLCSVRKGGIYMAGLPLLCASLSIKTELLGP